MLTPTKPPFSTSRCQMESVSSRKSSCIKRSRTLRRRMPTRARSKSKRRRKTSRRGSRMQRESNRKLLKLRSVRMSLKRERQRQSKGARIRLPRNKHASLRWPRSRWCRPTSYRMALQMVSNSSLMVHQGFRRLLLKLQSPPYS